MELSSKTKEISTNKSKSVSSLSVFLLFSIITVISAYLMGHQSPFLDLILLSVFICVIFFPLIANWIEEGIQPNFSKLSIAFLIILFVFLIPYQLLGVYVAMLCIIKILRVDSLIF